MRALYIWDENIVVSEIQSIVVEPLAAELNKPGKMMRVTLVFHDGGELCMGDCFYSESIYEKSLKEGFIDLTRYSFNK